MKVLIGVAAVVLFVLAAAVALLNKPDIRQNAYNHNDDVRIVVDSMGRRIEVPVEVERVVCSGSGCLRLLTYLGAQDKIVAVDSIEQRGPVIDSRPYALANPKFRTMPVFGEFRGQDSPEKILSLDPAPQVILKTFGATGHDADLLQRRTGIPVVVLEYGNMGASRDDLYESIRTMAEVVDKRERAEEVISFFDGMIEDLERRASASSGAGATCYIGGIAMRGPLGFNSTEPAYPPFAFVRANNIAAEMAGASHGTQASVAREQIIAWDPEIVFLDLSTTRMGAGAGGLHELRNHPAYRGLRAVNDDKVYGVLPYNSYAANFESIFANAYFIGKILHPAAFDDIDPAAKANHIYEFLVGAPVFEKMNAAFGGKVFQPVEVFGSAEE